MGRRCRLSLRGPRRPRGAAVEARDRAVRGRDRAARAREARHDELPGLLGQLGFSYRQDGDLEDAEKALTERAYAIDGEARPLLGVVGDARRDQARAGQAEGGARAARAGAGSLRQDRAEERRPVQLVHRRRAARARRLQARRDSCSPSYRACIEKHATASHTSLRHRRARLACLYMGDGKHRARRAAARRQPRDRRARAARSCCRPAPRPITRCTSRATLPARHRDQLRARPRAARARRRRGSALTTLLRRKGRVLDAAAASLATIRAEAVARGQAAARRSRERAHPAREAHRRRARRRPATATTRRRSRRSRIRSRSSRSQVGKKSAAYRVVTQPIELAGGAEADPEGRAARRDRELPAVRSQGAVPAR